MAKKDGKVDAFDMVSRAVNAIEGEGKDIVVIKPELIEPLIRQKIEAITQEIETLQKCTLTFANSPTGKRIDEAAEEGVELKVVAEELKKNDADKPGIRGKAKPGSDDLYAIGSKWSGGNYLRWKSTKGSYETLSCTPQISSMPCTKIESSSSAPCGEPRKVFKLVKKKYNHSDFYPDCHDEYKRDGEFLIEYEEQKITKIHKLTAAECSGKCTKADVQNYLTGVEITSDQVAARAQEVLKLKIEQRQKLEDMHLRLITGVVERINE